MSKVSRWLVKLEACKNAVKWSEQFDMQQDAWGACERADWMLWYLGRMVERSRFSRRRLVLLACKCARTALMHLPENERRPLQAIKTAEAWARGKPGVSLSDVRDAYAADAAYAAYAAAAYATADAAYAAYAAAYAAYAAYAAAAYATADAAYAAAAAAADARVKAHKKLCRMIRREIPDIRKAVR